MMRSLFFTDPFPFLHRGTSKNEDNVFSLIWGCRYYHFFIFEVPSCKCAIVAPLILRRACFHFLHEALSRIFFPFLDKDSPNRRRGRTLVHSLREGVLWREVGAEAFSQQEIEAGIKVGSFGPTKLKNLAFLWIRFFYFFRNRRYTDWRGSCRSRRIRKCERYSVLVKHK